MTKTTADEQMSETAELLHSLHDSVRRVRQQAEFLAHTIQAVDDPDLTVAAKQIAAVEGLIRTCQKVEANLVEQQQRQVGIKQGGQVLDLDEVRAEVGSRLDRLRTSCDKGEVPE